MLSKLSFDTHWIRIPESVDGKVNAAAPPRQCEHLPSCPAIKPLEDDHVKSSCDCPQRCADGIGVTPIPHIPLRTEKLKRDLASLLSLLRSAKAAFLPTNGKEAQGYVLCETVFEAVRAWMLIFYAHGFEFSNFEERTLLGPLMRSLRRALATSALVGWMSYFKYVQAACYSAWTGDVLPNAPKSDKPVEWGNPKFLLGGPFYKFFNVLKRQGKAESLALSFLMAKKGQPRPTDDLVKKSVAESVATMTSRKVQYRWKEVVDLQSPFRDKLYESPEDRMNGSKLFTFERKFGRKFMAAEIRRTTREVLDNMDCSLNALIHYFLPSSHANYRYSMAKYGTYGFLESETDLLHRFQAECLDNKLLFPRFKQKLCTLVDRCGEYFGYSSDITYDVDSDTYSSRNAEAEIENLEREVIGLEIDDSNFLVKWRQFYWRCFKLAELEEPLARAVGLSESLKVRVITKGPPMTYFVLKPFQKLFWGCLQKFWNFELTGTPITEKLMNQRFGRMIVNDSVYRMHSGDYKDATNQMHSWCSDVFAEEATEIMTEKAGYSYRRFGNLIKTSLTQHIYDCKDVLDGERFRPQQNGQLMGSIMSFPVLCIVNAALLRVAYEYAHAVRGCRLKDLPIWINGDDCLTFYTDSSFPTYWRNFGNIVGLEESIGKTYDSKMFCSINSRSFRVDPENGFFRMIPFINLGVAMGIKRSVNTLEKSEDGLFPTELGPLQRKLLENLDGDMAARAANLFLYLNNDTLKKFEGPWFLPTWCGGCGLRDVDGMSSCKNANEEDLITVRIVTELLASGSERPVNLPKGEWQHHKIVKKFLDENWPLVGRYSTHKRVLLPPDTRNKNCPYCLPVSPYPGDQSDWDYGRAFLCVCSLLWIAYPRTSGLSNLLRKSDAKAAAKEYYRDAVKLWRKAKRVLRAERQNGRFVRPVLVEDLEYEPRPDIIPIWTIGK